MDKYDFLMALSEKLQSLPEADRQRSLDYYAEIIDDRMEEGLSEEEAVAAIGNVDDIARTILSEAPVAPPAPKESRRLQWWEITLLILGSPIWISLLIAAAAVVFAVCIGLISVAFAVWISLWSTVISLYATAVALGFAALGCIIGSFFMVFYGTGELLIAWGAALICASLAILLFLLSNLAAKGMVALTKLTWAGIRRIFKRKEQTV